MKRVVVTIALMAVVLVSCHKDKEPTFDEQLQKDIGIIDMYLSDNQITALQDPSGLRYVITIPGTGKKPGATSKITIRFVGKLLSNREVFAQSTKPVTLLLSDEITAWVIGFPLISKGSSATFYVPSGLAFGSAGVSSVPPNSNLIFEVDLIDDDVQLQNDIATIDKYLADSSIVAVKDTTGLRYVIKTKGTGIKPVPTSLVNFKYTGKLMSNNKIFSQPTGAVSYPLNSLMDGLQLGLLFLPVGSVATFYIPSGLGYAANGTPDQTVPPNANLIFDIELVNVQ